MKNTVLDTIKIYKKFKLMHMHEMCNNTGAVTS